MQGIPDRIQAEDLVSEELHQIHKPGGNMISGSASTSHVLRERHHPVAPRKLNTRIAAYS